MKRLFTLLLIVCTWLCIPQKMIADTKGVYLETVEILNGKKGSYVTSSSNISTVHPFTWVHDNTYKIEIESCASATFNFRIAVDGWGKYQVHPNSNDLKLEINEEGESASLETWYNTDNATNNTWVVTWPTSGKINVWVDLASNNQKVWVDKSSGLSYTDTEFEMVAEYDGKSLVLPLSCVRHRAETDLEGDNSGEMSTSLFTVGFKDELLPGKANDKVKVYVRGKNNKNAQFRPSLNGSYLGNNYALLNNTSLESFRNEAYITGVDAVSSGNAFIITKGSGVSYTIGLNLGGQINETTTYQNVKYPYEYTIKANSLSLFTNMSLDTYYGNSNKYSSKYKNKSGNDLTKKQNLEDYYLFGTIYGTRAENDKKKGDYMSPLVSEWSQKDDDGYLISNYFKMEKQVYLNPNDKSVVDSIVYSKAIQRPKKFSGEDGVYSNMYMVFAPQSLIEVGGNYGGETFTEYCPWNYVVRPEVFSQKDGTAVKGSVYVSGVTTNSKRNGEQSLNPLVDNDKDHYIIRLNTTTSTYRVEFVNATPITISKYGIRTFVSRFNYAIPDGYAAYAAQSFSNESGNEKLNGLPNGKIELRRLKFIPANEPVVLIYNANFKNPFNESNQAVTRDFTELTGGAGDPNGYLELETQEDWWTKDYSTDEDNDYNNLLVGALDDEVIENGKYQMINDKYHYDYRHFALNCFHNTKYYQDNDLSKADDYVGFFRAAGKILASNAYLRLTDEDMKFNGQLLDKIEGNLDVDPSTNQVVAPAKVSFGFDVEPWDDVTAITEVKTEVKQDDAYYTLQGMKVSRPIKGIYIHNGKKMIIK